MNARANLEMMKRAGTELYDTSNSLSRICMELEEIEGALRRQTEFEGCVRALRRTAEQTRETRYHLAASAQGLENITGLLQNTENRIEQRMEILPMPYLTYDTGRYPLLKLKQRLSTFLYGGRN